MTDTATVTRIGVEGARDTRMEQWLDSHHVTWTWEPQFSLAVIDVERSLANQARVGDALLAEVVELYVCGYERGDEFPPLVVRRTGAGGESVVVLGGNHRMTAACQVGLATHRAYVVSCTDEAALMLMYEDNSRHGAQLPKQQRLAQAVHLVELGWTQAAAAIALGVREPELSNARALARSGRRARALEVPAWDRLPAAQQLELARISSDPVFVEAVKLVAGAAMPAIEARAFVKQVRGARSDEAALTLIGTELEERQDQIQRRFAGKAGRTPPKTTEYGKAKAAVTALAGVDPADVVGSCPTADARRRLKDQIGDAARVCMALDRIL